ncbi:recombinase family protein [Paenibacillus sedimenti]|uniref:Recombinase family protein n=1 Tax=Paenibacillus sedimenti TaxID=2770274 RepID=A0A926KUZ2_9BACL|nr:recombinase family protein [Paenibacillus sedimenti]
MAKIRYVRVSTEEQTLDLQLDALQDAGCKKVYQEKMTGKKTDRPQLSRCLEYLREGKSYLSCYYSKKNPLATPCPTNIIRGSDR